MVVQEVAGVLLAMLLGFLAAEVLLEYGVLYKLSFLRRVARLANLPDVCGVTFATAFVSPAASNAMLQSLRDRGVLNDREVLLASLLNAAAVPFYETFTVYLPVVIPLLGPRLGLMYMSAMWLNGALSFAVVVAAGRLALNRRETGLVEEMARKPGRNYKAALRRGLRRFVKTAVVFAATVTTVELLLRYGVLQHLATPLSSYAMGISPQLLPAVGIYVLHPTAGMAAVGQLVKTGVVGEVEALAALLLASVFMLPLLYLRVYIPQWVAIFGPRVGLARGAIGLSIALAARIIVLASVLALVH
ncbi:nucleoside recognition protein [Pyrobaculum neutrophilum]|uniref:Nucleoside recognition domain protein n=1 Tax=Pyrobaculum neutrophilum (strain DSM 2338 / JCM 9278 / NBRC 100436 / V24Sta) TaxID=444157 RepID=B1YBT4_PYRNV|nr:nucleoside recognition protein [Pyrobaculum neutrophilum]ACB39318.1 nucleoside recognition domain protein [Pyrobaculum neutrophilum V24Sta]